MRSWQRSIRGSTASAGSPTAAPGRSASASVKLPDGARAGETVQTVLFPLSMDGQRLGIRSDPPAMGQHTDVLLQEAGYSAAEVAALRAARAVA